MDCLVAAADIDDLRGKEREGYMCEHWMPEYWESKGYVRNWGDAAVMNWPHLEVLRRETRSAEMAEVEFLVLAPFALRRPLKLFANAEPNQRFTAWGAY
jgi:hypothetical protein